MRWTGHNSQNSIISSDYSWFLGKNLSNFVPLLWKLNNPYYHTPQAHYQTMNLFDTVSSLFQAMVYNFLSACTCYIGLILGILLGEMHIGNQYIFAAAGGMFLYIALVDMVPELNATLDQLSKQSAKSAFTVFLLQNIGILTGIFSLFILAKFQDKIQIDFWIEPPTFYYSVNILSHAYTYYCM